MLRPGQGAGLVAFRPSRSAPAPQVREGRGFKAGGFFSRLVPQTARSLATPDSASGLVMERMYPILKEAKHFHCFTHDASIKRHPAYKAAKAGDADRAWRLIDD